MNNSAANTFTGKITLAVTGASGTAYAMRLLECLVRENIFVFLLISDAAFVVAEVETGLSLPREKEVLGTWLQRRFQARDGQICILEKNDWHSSVASGSNAPDQMVICPASMGTLSAIANGASNNLIERAADVALKERHGLILVPRESPYSEIHLENMLKLSRMGSVIIPASPGFYQQPKTISDMIDFIVARILQHLNISHQLISKWGDI